MEHRPDESGEVRNTCTLTMAVPRDTKCLHDTDDCWYSRPRFG